MRLGILFITGIFCAAQFAYAVSTTTPKVTIKKQKDTYVTLQVIASDLAKKDVKIKVKIEDQDNDTSTTKTFDAKLSKSGKVDVKVDGLTKDIEYTFKAQIKKSSGGSYSGYSDSVSVNGGGDASYGIKISTSDVSSNSFIVKATAATLKKKDVKIKVRIENEDTDKIETRVFGVKLNSKGAAKMTIDGLNKDTDYKVKAAIKKKNDDTYSAFSNEKKVTTD